MQLNGGGVPHIRDEPRFAGVAPDPLDPGLGQRRGHALPAPAWLNCDAAEVVPGQGGSVVVVPPMRLCPTNHRFFSIDDDDVPIRVENRRLECLADVADGLSGAPLHGRDGIHVFYGGRADEGPGMRRLMRRYFHFVSRSTRSFYRPAAQFS